jgi:hypothetical protein
MCLSHQGQANNPLQDHTEITTGPDYLLNISGSTGNNLNILLQAGNNARGGTFL